jgi:hypothetical protein
MKHILAINLGTQTILDLKTMIVLYKLGAKHFGIGAASVLKILDECAAIQVGFSMSFARRDIHNL